MPLMHENHAFCPFILLINISLAFLTASINETHGEYQK